MYIQSLSLYYSLGLINSQYNNIGATHDQQNFTDLVGECCITDSVLGKAKLGTSVSLDSFHYYNIQYYIIISCVCVCKVLANCQCAPFIVNCTLVSGNSVLQSIYSNCVSVTVLKVLAMHY